MNYFSVKFMFPKKATKIDEIFIVDLTLCSKCQIDSEDFVNYCGQGNTNCNKKSNQKNYRFTQSLLFLDYQRPISRLS